MSTLWNWLGVGRLTSVREHPLATHAARITLYASRGCLYACIHKEAGTPHYWYTSFTRTGHPGCVEMEATDVRDAAEAARQLRRKQLSEEREPPSERSALGGVPGSRALSTLVTCAQWLDQASVLTAHGQACCRLALGFSLVPRLCPDEFPDGIVPEPELLQRIGQHLHDQAIQRKVNKLQEIKSQAIAILDRVLPELEAAYAGIDTLRKQDMLEARDVTPKQCRPVCEALCVLMDKNPEIVGTES
jgi:hypothetical protein